MSIGVENAKRDEDMKKEMAIGCGIGCTTSLLLVVVAVVCLLTWFYNMSDNSLSKKEIFKLVNDNYSIILEDIREKDFTDTEKLNGVQEVYSDTEIIDMYCGGSGFGSATSYYGFYYSPDGLPKDSWCGSGFGSPEQLVPDGNGFSIKYSDNDNCYYTEKIRENFYYYEAHF